MMTVFKCSFFWLSEFQSVCTFESSGESCETLISETHPRSIKLISLRHSRVLVFWKLPRYSVIQVLQNPKAGSRGEVKGREAPAFSLLPFPTLGSPGQWPSASYSLTALSSGKEGETLKRAHKLVLTVRWFIHWLWRYSRVPPKSSVSWLLSM